ncbi:outer membrane protein assembly factor BamA [Candidatus Pseudothioglobus singularis]|nr:outer membrane protein assembly factor BamA [Candidatus Pseudothioglobus singularis]
MKNKLNQLLVLLFLFFTTQAFANQIVKFNFIGLNNTSETSLLNIMPIKVGDEYSESATNSIIQSLFNTELFSDITILNNEGTISITLLENPTIKYFDFKLDSGSGFSNWLKNEKMLITTELLDIELESNNLSAGNPYNQNKLDKFILNLESKYLESGYYNVEISQNVSIDSQNRIGIELNIQQGDRIKIDQFTITGASQISEKTLLKLFNIGESDMFMLNYFTNKDLFTEAEFAQGIDLMTNQYFDLGYLDFKIIDIASELNDSKEKISLNIEISEGIQYKLGQISFEGGLGIFSKEELNDAITTSEGDTFNRSTIIKDIQTLTDKFADKGFAFVNVNPVTTDFLDTININFNIDLNKKVYINRISISGNTRTQDEVVRREIGIAEGGLYSRSILRDSLLKLRRLGYFSEVDISTSEVMGMPDKIDIYINVEETQTGSISLTMSHSNNHGISLGAGIQEKNIFGSGNTLNSEFKISESYNKLSVYFMNPNFNDNDHSISFGAFRSEINDDDVAENSYEINATGLSFGYGIPLTESTRLNSNFEYSKNQIKCSSLLSSSGYESSQCASSKKDEFRASINWSENTLNNYMYPTSGFNNNLSAGISLPLGDYRYINLSGTHSSYKPINDVMTLKLTGSLNVAKGYSGKELPFYKRYFGGGSGSIRGFGNKTLGPLYPNGKAKGGEVSILGSANIITPAFFFDNNENMRISAFIDTGNIFEKSSSIKIDELRVSTGLSFAYLTPIGAIGAYIATPILKKDGDIIEDFGFSLGTGF